MKRVIDLVVHWSVPHSYRQKAEYTTLYSFAKRILATGSVVATSFADITRENPHKALVDEYERIASMFTELNEDEVEKIIAALPSAFYASEKLLLAKLKRGFVPCENLRMNRLNQNKIVQVARFGLIPIWSEASRWRACWWLAPLSCWCSAMRCWCSWDLNVSMMDIYLCPGLRCSWSPVLGCSESHMSKTVWREGEESGERETGARMSLPISAWLRFGGAVALDWGRPGSALSPTLRRSRGVPTHTHVALPGRVAAPPNPAALVTALPTSPALAAGTPPRQRRREDVAVVVGFERASSRLLLLQKKIKKWRFGRWFSFSIGQLLGSMLIFRGVSDKDKKFPVPASNQLPHDLGGQIISCGWREWSHPIPYAPCMEYLPTCSLNWGEM